MSALDKIRAQEAKLSFQDWIRPHKQTLVLWCATHGLSTAGEKKTLVQRHYEHLNDNEGPLEYEYEKGGNYESDRDE